MSQLKFIIRVTLFTSIIFLLPSLAEAQATRTWVSGVGDDANPCSRTAPCKTFQGTISKTAAGGEINCLDPAGFGAVTITKSLTIDCASTTGGILSAGTNAIIINAATGSVRLRGLQINGFSTGLSGVRILSAARVEIEDSIIDGVTNHGVSIENTTNVDVSIKNTRIRNVGSNGIDVSPTASTLITNVSITNSSIEKSNNGISSIGKSNVVVTNSSISHNTNIGYFGRKSEVTLIGCTIAYNATGVQSESPANIKLNNVTVTNNTTGLFPNGGNIVSFRNNSIYGNGTDGAPNMFIMQQ